jgi:hypothetical protein
MTLVVAGEEYDGSRAVDSAAGQCTKSSVHDKTTCNTTVVTAATCTKGAKPTG